MAAPKPDCYDRLGLGSRRRTTSTKGMPRSTIVNATPNDSPGSDPVAGNVRCGVVGVGVAGACPLAVVGTALMGEVAGTVVAGVSGGGAAVVVVVDVVVGAAASPTLTWASLVAPVASLTV